MTLPDVRKGPGTNSEAPPEAIHRQEDLTNTVVDSPVGNRRAERSPTRQTILQVDIDHFRARVLQDALTEATAVYWRRRADSLLAAVSRPGDYRGKATAAEIAARDKRLREDAAACLRHAYVVGPKPDISEDVANALSEAA